jgi:hypothetical protein
MVAEEFPGVNADARRSTSPTRALIAGARFRSQH